MLVYKQHTPRCKGFTMIELLITIAIVGIVTAMGVPSFNQTITNNRLTTHTNDLVTAINIARSEAIKRGARVAVNRTGAQWETGWIVYIDQDNSGAFIDNGNAALCEVTADNVLTEDCVLRNYAAINPGYTLRTNAANDISYAPTGLLSGGAAGTYRLCENTANTAIARQIVLSLTGRTRVNTGTAQCP